MSEKRKPPFKIIWLPNELDSNDEMVIPKCSYQISVDENYVLALHVVSTIGINRRSCYYRQK